MGEIFYVYFDKLFIVYIKESNVEIDNYWDSICLISFKWYLIIIELEIFNYWCGILKDEFRKYVNSSLGV